MVTLIALVAALYAASSALSWAVCRPHVTLRIVPKRGWFWRAFAVVYRPFGKSDDYYTTLGNVVGVPEGDTLPPDAERHENQHADDTARLGWGNVWLGLPAMAVLYLLLPLPVGLAWFRYFFERRAYLAGGTDPERIAEHLSGRGYGWAWPRAWIVEDLRAPE